MARFELTANARTKSLLRSRYPQVAVAGLMLAGFLFAGLAGLLGTPVGNHNFVIVFVWIAWWAVLILLLVPFLGRGWCAICPIPLPGEWLARGRLLGPNASGPRGLNLRWPRKLRSIWLQNIAFVLLALFSPVLLTSPLVTALVLAGMLACSLGLSMIFERRTFCQYVCPVSGFIGLYAQNAPIELRIKERSVCSACRTKPCYNGSAEGYACPWDVFPAGLSDNTRCGLCLECLRTCPQDNIAINARPFGADLANARVGLDQAFKAFIMLGAALIYSAVLLGPWGVLKNTAYRVGSPAWFGYAAAFLGIMLALIPGLFFLASALGGRREGMRPFALFAKFSSSLVPLGMMFWVAFSLTFVLTNASYILATLSDPLGLGWNLFRTADIAWTPLLGQALAPVETLALLLGLAWSGNVARRIATEQDVSAIPVLGYNLAVTLVMLWLLL
jgi:polyferredoxin